MSFERLEQQKLFLREERWGTLPLRPPISRLPVIGCVALGALGAVLMVLGRGGLLTWIGAVLVAAFFWGFTWIAMVAVRRQNATIEPHLAAPVPEPPEAEEAEEAEAEEAEEAEEE